jgi:hypothetical protein
VCPLLFTLDPFPRDDGAMIDLAQHGCRGDAMRPHEVPHVEPVGPAGLLALLLRQSDFFFGNDRELVERPERAAPIHQNGKR